MAINVNKFLVSNSLSSIGVDLEVTAGQTVTQILFWNQDTYKNPATQIDLSSLLSGANNLEAFTIVPGDIGETSFTGMYFMQIITSEPETTMVATVNLTQYYIIQAKLISNVDLSCLNCNINFQNALLFDMYLQATKNSMILGRFRDAINNLANLIITIDSSDCDECNNIEPLVSSAGNLVSVGVIDCLLAEV